MRVDGKLVHAADRLRYVALHKPVGYLTSCSDAHGRKTVLDLVPAAERLFPVGRLDLESRGLLLLTNDGELALRLAHPRYRVSKTYRVRVRGRPPAGALAAAVRGVVDQGERLRCAEIDILGGTGEYTDLRVVLREGKRRELRRLWKALGHPVLDLCREAIGSVRLGRLREGTFRELTGGEVRDLQAGAGLAS